MTEKEKLEQKLHAVRDLVISAERSVANAKRVLNELLGKKHKEKKANLATDDLHVYASDDDRIIEGVFTGEQMLGADKQLYPVPSNYASKSLLVQWSKMKAIIDADGKITYKIIEEIPYETKTGVLVKEGNEYQVVCDGATYSVLLASVTFHKGTVGDKLSIRIPKGKNATYAVVDAVIPKGG